MTTSESPATTSRLVRVFVSSTFQDMHAERDHLNRVVWPELRDRCLRLGVDFIAIDLRWGVTREDVERQGATAICLAEIARCRYFVGLLGDRYGWVPPPDTVPEPIFTRVRSHAAAARLLDDCYQLDPSLDPPAFRLRSDRTVSPADSNTLARIWEGSGLPDAGRSITELEVRRAFETVSPKRTMIYVRDLALGVDGAKFSPVFEEADQQRRERQAALRTEVTRRKRLTTRKYRTTFEGVKLSSALLPEQLTTADRRVLADGIIRPAELEEATVALHQSVDEFGTAALGGLEAWGEHVQEDLWVAIERDLVAAHRRAGDVSDRADHERFLVERTALFIGRDDLLERMFAYLEDEECRHPLVVTGQAGSGKSALLAECARRCRDRFGHALVLPHFIGAAPGSTSPVVTVRSLFDALRRQGRSRSQITEPPHDPNELFDTFSIVLAAAASTGPVIVLIDALDQLDADAGGHELPWLPAVLPPGVKVIVSALDGDILKQLRVRVPPEEVLVVGPMTDQDRIQLAAELLGRRAKRLMPEQVARLLDSHVRSDAVLPLYITVAVEELSLFGRYEALDRRIDAMPPTISELFEQVLARVELDHGQPLTELVLSLLATSRVGLLEAEILDLLERAEPGFARLSWIRLYRSLQSYLRRMDEGSGGGVIGFFHEQLRRAVVNRYFDMRTPSSLPTDAFTVVHRELASYFESSGRSAGDTGGWQLGRVRPLSELPFHLARSQQWEHLRAVITEFDFIQAAVTALGPQALIDHYALALGAGKAAYPDDTRRGLELLQSSIRLSAHSVADDPQQLATQLLARQIGATDPEVRRVVDDAREWCGSAWLRPRNAFMASGGELQRVLIGSDAGPHVDMTADGRRVVACMARRLGVWDLDSGRLERTLVDRYTEAFAITADGAAVIVSTPGGVLHLLDLSTGGVIQTFEGHVGKLAAVTFTGDGEYVVSGNATVDATQPVELAVTAWHVASATPVHRFVGHGGYAIKDVVVTSDGRTIVSVGDDFTARVWDVETGHLRHALEHDALAVPAVAAVSDHTALTAAADGSFTLWNLETGSAIDQFSCPPIRTTRVTPYANAIALPSQGRYAILAMMDETLRTWSPSERHLGPVLGGHTDEVIDVAVSRDGSIAVSTSTDGTVRLWKLDESIDTQAAVGHASGINAVAVTPDDTHTLSASSDHTILIWDNQSGAVESTLTGHQEAVVEIHVTPDGERAVSRSSDATVRLWQLATRTEEQSWPLASRFAEFPNDRHVVLTDRGKHVVYAYSGGVAMQQIASGDTLWMFSGDWMTHYVAASSEFVLICTDQAEVVVVSAESGSRLHRLKARDQHAFIAAVISDARALVGYSDGALRIWDLQNGKLVRTFRRGRLGHNTTISALGVAGNGDLAVSGDNDGGLMVWDVRTCTAHAPLVGHTSRIWNLATSRNGRLVASACADQTLRVWDVLAGRQVAALRTDGDVNACAFGADDQFIVAGGDSGRVQLLDLIEP